MIVPAILEEDFEEIKNKVKKLDKHSSSFQIDVVDGIILNGKSFLNLKALDLIKTNASFEVDLMVQNPHKYVEEKIVSVFKICSFINFANNVPKFIKYAKALNYKVGISVDFNTKDEEINKYINQIDYIQFMGVEAGGQGRKFNEKIISKIEKFQKKFPMFEIQLDGGINKDNFYKLLNIGIKNFVIGSAIFNQSDPLKEYINFKEKLNDTRNNTKSTKQ